MSKINVAEVVVQLIGRGLQAMPETGPAPTELLVTTGRRTYGFMVNGDDGIMPACAWDDDGPFEQGAVFEALASYDPTGQVWSTVDAIVAAVDRAEQADGGRR